MSLSARAEEQQKEEKGHLFGGPQGGAPTTVAGGFQGFDLSNSSDPPKTDGHKATVDNINAAHPSSSSRRRFAARYPRTFHVFIRIVLPLFFLIVLAFFCGYFLALLESKEEKKANDSMLAGVVDEWIKIERLVELATTTPTLCLQAYEGDTGDATKLKQHMEDCGKVISKELSHLAEEFKSKLQTEAYASLTFDWISCGEGLGDAADRDEQARQVIDDWLEQYEDSMEASKADGLSENEARDKALADSTGHDSCDVNAAGGAIFWFTIMSTIGYGNTAPVTAGGRAWVYTLGFVSILIFTALIGQAGYICLVVVDDLLLRYRPLQWLTRGVPAAILWASCLCLWLLVISATATADQDDYVSGLNEAFWFSYMSVTTVGLGDIHIPHDTFQPVDMLYVPLLFLIGFVLLANFLLKLSNILTSQGVSQDRTLEGVLEKSRQQHQQQQQHEGEPKGASAATSAAAIEDGGPSPSSNGFPIIIELDEQSA